jgi:hypothetical protein
MRLFDSDPWLRRLEIEAVVACMAMAFVGLVVSGGRPAGALSVLAGGALIGFVYESVKRATDHAMRRGESEREGALQRGWRLVKFFTRYGILAVAAYLVVVRLRLHVAGVLAGASSFVLAVLIEAGRVVRARSDRDGPEKLRIEN